MSCLEIICEFTEISWKYMFNVYVLVTERMTEHMQGPDKEGIT